ncbi:MAG TPA: class I SAM-dependent methyltransferase, partial [Patescibacteria group bacterium]|nr:class I SAM-dependent methyltransferase [Patescibacteria group bacterium]
MKQQIKNTLQNLGLLDISRQLFKNTRSATPTILVREFSNGNSHNGIPLPPPQLRFLVIGTRWSEIFISSGKKIVDDMFLKLREAGIEPENFRNILDFGCGCGRLIRHVKVLKNAKLFGCDYNSELISWCKNNLNFAEFY